MGFHSPLAPLGNMPRGKPIRLGISGLHNQHIHVDDSYIVFLGFYSQDNYSLRDGKEYESFLSITDPTAIPLRFRFFAKISKRADMISRLIESGLSNRPYSPVRANVGRCKSQDRFGYWVVDCSGTRISSSSITGHHPQATGSLIGEGFTPLQRCSQCILQPQPTGQNHL